MKIVLGDPFYPNKMQVSQWAEKAGVNLTWKDESEEYCGHWFLENFDVREDEYDGWFNPVHDISRTDEALVELVENGLWKHYRVVEVPDDVDWYIGKDELGYEWVAEKHRIWG